ncbi:hypothetical protein AB0K16_22560 [Nonomuraea jabiensis]|uniref:hypothetical protein n=1 Tax=Nonomuraea jabiensis TaxID=882448 RepID=UPI00341AE18A
MTKKMFAAGGYDFGGTKLQNVQDGTASTDVVTKQQLDAAVSSVTSNLDFKGSVRVASTANVSTTSAPATVDGVSLASGNRLLLKDQTTASENGIWVFTSAGTALTRATDADASTEVTPGLWVIVEEGTVNSDTAWLLTTNAPITIGSTSLTFTKYAVAGGGGLSKYTVTGPGTAGTSWTITHALGTDDVIVGVREIGSKEEVDVSIVHTDTSTVTISASATLAQNAYRAVVIG